MDYGPLKKPDSSSEHSEFEPGAVREALGSRGEFAPLGFSPALGDAARSSSPHSPLITTFLHGKPSRPTPQTLTVVCG